MGLLLSKIKYLLQAKTTNILKKLKGDAQGVNMNTICEEKLNSITKRNTLTNKGAMSRAEIIKIFNLAHNFNSVESHRHPLLGIKVKRPHSLAQQIEKYNPTNAFEDMRWESSCKNEGNKKNVRISSSGKKAVRFNLDCD